MDKTFWEAVKGRRSIYGLDDTPVVSGERVEQILADAVRHVPSPYNSQSTRLQLMLGEAHKMLWVLTLEALRSVTRPERFAETEEKISTAFASGYGTVLFYIDRDVVNALAARFPKYADNFSLWSQHSSAMHQFVIWTALEAEGLGASLQHYNPLIDETIKKRWDVPQSWQLVAQMPFGRPAEPPGHKEISAVEPRLMICRDAGRSAG